MNHRLLNKYLFLFDVGGLLYILIELIWRGRSHWTMFLLGGICFVFLGLINEVIPWQMPLWQQILIGAVGITTLEFLTGCKTDFSSPTKQDSSLPSRFATAKAMLMTARDAIIGSAVRATASVS